MLIRARQHFRTIWFIFLTLAWISLAGGGLAQTPEAQPTDPPVTEIPVTAELPTEIPEPTATEPAAPEPTATEAPEESPTDPPLPTEVPATTETPKSTTEVEVVDPATVPTVEEETPTPSPTLTPSPTPVPSEPDQLVLETGSVITLGPDEYADIVLTYTAGSNRNSTQVTMLLESPGNDLQGWTLQPLEHTDLLNDSSDPLRDLKARIEVTGATNAGDTFQTTWRVTAPSHVETALTIRVDVSAAIHADDGAADGDAHNDLVSINAAPSVHSPVLSCNTAGDDTEGNSWRCELATSHPGTGAHITASSTAPAGWELKLDGTELTSEPVALSTEAIAESAFSLSAQHLQGCPDLSTASSAEIILNITYPSGEVAELRSKLSLAFTKPQSMLAISSLGFDELDLRQEHETTGHLTIAFAESPCAWQSTIRLTDLVSDDSTIRGEAIRIESVEGLPNATITFEAGVIVIRNAESDTTNPAGEFTINFAVELPQQVQPGAYRIGIVTEFLWIDD